MAGGKQKGPAERPAPGRRCLDLARGALFRLRFPELGFDQRVEDGALVGGGVHAAELVADAILRAVTQATGVPGFRAVRDL